MGSQRPRERERDHEDKQHRIEAQRGTGISHPCRAKTEHEHCGIHGREEDLRTREDPNNKNCTGESKPEKHGPGGKAIGESRRADRRDKCANEESWHMAPRKGQRPPRRHPPLERPRNLRRLLHTVTSSHLLSGDKVTRSPAYPIWAVCQREPTPSPRETHQARARREKNDAAAARWASPAF